MSEVKEDSPNTVTKEDIIIPNPNPNIPISATKKGKNKVANVN